MTFSEYKRKCKTGYPASIPQIVAHIQKYLSDNPIPDSEDIGTIIYNYITENPEVLQVPVMEGATPSTDGESGLVPQPLAGDQGKVLFGDGTFKTIPEPTPPSVMDGATSEADGESGLVPQPLAGDQGKVLFGDGTFKTIPEPTVMEGATASTDGESGLVPQPLAGDHNHVLLGSSVWSEMVTAFTLTLQPSDFMSNQSWPGNITPIEESSLTCLLATKTNADANDDDTIYVTDYSKINCPSPLYLYVDDGYIYIATTTIITDDVTIKGLILHNIGGV